VVPCLAPEYAIEVRNLLLEPPGEQPYETLKVQLTKRTPASEQCRIQDLLSTEELGRSNRFSDAPKNPTAAGWDATLLR